VKGRVGDGEARLFFAGGSGDGRGLLFLFLFLLLLTLLHCRRHLPLLSGPTLPSPAFKTGSGGMDSGRVRVRSESEELEKAGGTEGAPSWGHR